MDCETIAEILRNQGYSPRLHGFSALDRYLGREPLPFVWVETGADISILARLFDGLRFPGVDLADAALETGEAPDKAAQTWYFRCRDPQEAPWEAESRRPSYRLLSLSQDWHTGRFHDPGGLYPLIRALRGKPMSSRPGGGDPAEPAGPWWAGLNPCCGKRQALMDGALLLARYGTAGESLRHCLAPMLQSCQTLPKDSPPSPEAQRTLLTSVLVSPRPDWALELLNAAGFVEDFWPELALLNKVDHAKEYHPEGNVWNHTLETFRYRKNSRDLLLSLALLLHDTGKPLAASSGPRRFDGHAELGAGAARRFLKRLEFAPPLVEQVCYLVKNHMLPAALPRLPLSRTGEILESPLFPVLLELYRCDESSSFKGLDAYYESSAAYQAYLRYRRNPYRAADGKKLQARG